jgi:hypothetical protein
MWFKREQKNRRLNRGHVLDVKVRSDQARATRARLASVVLSVTFGTVFGLYLLWCAGEWALDRFVYENSTFAIRDIEVRTDGVIAPEQLRRWANVRPGANLIALDLTSVKRNFELVPRIDSVSIERVLPGTLKIRVTEREPVAQVNVPTTAAGGEMALAVFQLDKNGYVMKPLDPRQCTILLSQMNAQLPVITGVNVVQLQPGRRIESKTVQAALQLVGAFRRSQMAGFADLRRVDVSQPGVIVATTGQGGEITFALENPEQQLARWREIYDFGAGRNKMIASLDLAVANNVPVRWAETVSTPAAVPKNSNLSKNRRKNV